MGPKPIRGLFDHYGLDCLYDDLMMNMPFYRQHLKMCPENLIHQDIAVFLTLKRGAEDEKDAPATEVSAPSPQPEPEPQADPGPEPNIPLRGFNRDE